MPTPLEDLKSAMAQKGLSQTDLAKKAGLDPSTINKILSGARSPGLRAALAIQRVVGIDAARWSTDAVDADVNSESDAA